MNISKILMALVVVFFIGYTGYMSLSVEKEIKQRTSSRFTSDDFSLVWSTINVGDNKKCFNISNEEVEVYYQNINKEVTTIGKLIMEHPCR